MMSLQQEARAALDAKQSAEQQLASASHCPPWRHVAFALMMAALVASPGIAVAARMGLLALTLVAMALIVQSDRRRLGMFINGYRRGKTRVVAFVLLAVDLALYALSVAAGVRGDGNTPLLLGAAAFVASLVGSVIWQRVFVRELEG